MPQPSPTPAAPLARFNHHADPAIDFCVEVGDLEARLASLRTSLRVGLSSASDLSELIADIRKAMDFIVGGVPEAIDAKATLRQIEQDARTIFDDYTADAPPGLPRVHLPDNIAACLSLSELIRGGMADPRNAEAVQFYHSRNLARGCVTGASSASAFLQALSATGLSRPVDPAWIAPARPRWRAMLARIFR